MKRVHYLILSFSVILLDLWTKWLVVKRIDLHGAIPIIPNFVQLVHVRNTGAAFGIGANASSNLQARSWSPSSIASHAKGTEKSDSS